jgi:hypothetical protein
VRCTYLVQIFLGQLQLQQCSIDLVDNQDRLDSFSEGLSEHSFGLDTDTFDGVDDYKSSVSDTESSSDFGRKVDVTGGIDEIDQEVVSYQIEKSENEIKEGEK